MGTGVEVPPEILALSVGAIAVVVKFLVRTEILTACSNINGAFLTHGEDRLQIDAELLIVGTEDGKVFLIKFSNHL